MEEEEDVLLSSLATSWSLLPFENKTLLGMAVELSSALLCGETETGAEIGLRGERLSPGQKFLVLHYMIVTDVISVGLVNLGPLFNFFI